MSATHFDRIAAEYDESLPPHVVEHYLRKRLAFIERHCPPGRALDVGCGTGVLARRMARRGYSMVGVDASEGMLDVLRREDHAVQAVAADSTALPFERDSFDLVLCVAMLHHVAAPAPVRATLHEMVRVARPGGRVVVWDHNPRNPYWPILMRRVPQDTGEERLIPEREILDGLREGGAEPALVAQLGLVPDFAPPRLLGAFAALERRVEAVPLLRRLCAHTVVLAVKR